MSIQATSLPSGFTSDGLLPPGDFEMSIEQVRNSFIVQGGSGSRFKGWDRSWRTKLVNNLEMLCGQLWKCGIDDVYVNGSFVEEKSHPNDIDGYFLCEKGRLASGELQRELNLLDPFKIWTWDPRSRRPYRGYPKKQLPMWHEYRVELYPHYSGMLCGIRDQHGNEMEFPAAFRKTRQDDQQKGIVRIRRES